MKILLNLISLNNNIAQFDDRAVRRPCSATTARHDRAGWTGKNLILDEALHLHAALIPPVVMEGESLESVYQFDYLGCHFTSDGDDAADMRHRMVIAGERSRGLDYLSRDNCLVRSLKLRLYAASVCSTLTHRSKAWMLTLNGFSSRQIHCITGRSYREEVINPLYDLLTAVRTRRHQWLGHILRMPADRLVRHAVLALGQRSGPSAPYQPGSLLMDTPLPLNELVLRAAEDGTDSSPPLRGATL